MRVAWVNTAATVFNPNIFSPGSKMVKLLDYDKKLWHMEINIILKLSSILLQILIIKKCLNQSRSKKERNVVYHIWLNSKQLDLHSIYIVSGPEINKPGGPEQARQSLTKPEPDPPLCWNAFYSRTQEIA